MKEVSFSEQSMRELNQLAPETQLKLIEVLGSLELPFNSEIGCMQREGKIFYRIRFEGLRIYFIYENDHFFVHFILHERSWTDFAFRFKLPVNEELLIESHPSFWQYLESLTK